MTILAKVLRKTHEAIDICSYELARVDGSPLPAFTAGSHVDVQVPGGYTRQYSLCSDAADHRRYRIAVLRDPRSRGGSAGMHDQIKEGDTVVIGEPRNHFPLVPARRTLLFAGGIGVTPLLCMARHLNATGSAFTLHYCARSRERTAFRAEIEASRFAADVRFHFDDGAVEQKLDLQAVLAAPDPGTHIYVCGPGGFIDWVTATAATLGWPGSHVHLEYFGASPADTSADRPFQVRIASSGQLYEIPAGKTVIQVLQARGIEIPVSCEQGVCGTCITRVLEGECEHRDHYLTDEERAMNDQFTPCCSRARSELLVLDL